MDGAKHILIGVTEHPRFSGCATTLLLAMRTMASGCTVFPIQALMAFDLESSTNGTKVYFFGGCNEVASLCVRRICAARLFGKTFTDHVMQSMAIRVVRGIENVSFLTQNSFDHLYS